MEKCGNCSTAVIAGQACISCGHQGGAATPVAPEVPEASLPEQAPDPLADLMGNGRQESPFDNLKSSKIAPILAGVVAFALVAVGAITMFGGSSEPAEPETAPSTTVAVALTASTLTPSYCASPVPVAGAPEPDTNGTNVFQNFYLFGTTEWKQLTDTAAYNAAYINEKSVSTDLVAIDSDQDPAYVSCVTGTPNDNDKTCRIYEDAARHIISGANYNLQVFQLSTGEMVVEGPVRNAPATCPSAVVGNVSYSEFLPRQHDLAMWTANLAVPSQFTNVHLDREMMGGSPEWCQSPDTINTGSTATAPGVHVVAQEDISMNAASVDWATLKTTELSHVACTRFFPSGEEHRCEFQGNNSLVRPAGVFDITLIDIATGEFTAGEAFESGESCPGLVLFNREGQTKNEPALVPDELYEWLNAQNPDAEPAEDTGDSDGSEEVAE